MKPVRAEIVLPICPASASQTWIILGLVCLLLHPIRSGAALLLKTNAGLPAITGVQVISSNMLFAEEVGIAPSQITYTVTSLPANGTLRKNARSIHWAVRSATGHSYRLGEPVDWDSAWSEAIAEGGYLTSINDASEENWLTNAFERPIVGWLGMRKNGSWGWANGEPVTYTAWTPGEPSGDGMVAVIYFPKGDWNDISSDNSVTGLIEVNSVRVPIFTQDDVNNGRVTYQFRGGISGQDGFVFGVSSSSGAALSNFVFNIGTSSRTTNVFRPANLPSGLLGYWKLDELAGTRYDSSGRTNHLTANGSIASVLDDYWRSGEASINFVKADHFSLSRPSGTLNGLNISGVGGSFTFACWYKPQSLSQETLVCKGPSGARYMVVALGGPGGLAEFDLNVNASDILRVDAPSRTGKWYHLAVVFDEPADLAAIYVDGNCLGTASTSIQVGANTDDFFLGRSSSGDYADGLMKDAAIWNRPLTPVEVKSLALGVDLTAQAYRPGSITVAATHWWRLNELKGTRSDSAVVNPLPLTGPSPVLPAGGYFEGVGAKFSGANYLSVSNSPDFRFGTGDFAVGTWFNLSSLANSSRLLDCSVYDGGGWGVGIRSPTQLEVNLGGSSQSAWLPITIPPLALNTWYHLVVARSGGVTRTYLDGKQLDSRPDPFNYQPMRELDLGVFLYTFDNGRGNYFSGALQDTFIWKGYALTSNEIASLATGLPVQSAGVVSYWKLDEANGTRLDAIGPNDLNDVSGVRSVPGVSGNAADFAGDTNRHLTIADGMQRGLELTNQTYTLASWIRPAATGVNQFLIGKRGGGLGYFLRINATNQLELFNESSSIPDGSTITNAGWQHVMASWIAGANEASLWLNGVRTATGPLAPAASPSTNDFRLGKALIGNHYDGLLDEVVVAKRPFREEEVKALYNKGLNGLEAFGGVGAGGIDLAPSTLNFGSVPTNYSTFLPLTIRNTNGNSVTINFSAVSPFAIVGQSSIMLSTGEVRQVLVSFTPTQIGFVSNTLVLSGAFPSVSVAVVGEGVVNAIDTDGDGLPDFWERLYGLTPTNSGDANLVVPGDRLTYLQKFRYRLDPLTPDTDGDGLSDYDELFIYGTNPLAVDTDGDGMPDGWEVANHLNPLVNDANDDFDGDGVTNLTEYQNNLDPRRWVSRNDGTNDYQRLFGERRNRFSYDRNDRLVGAEYANGLVIAYQYDGNGNLLRQAYLDQNQSIDGLPLLWKFLNGLSVTNSTGPNDPYADPDGDGWSNYQEWKAGTSPTNAGSRPDLIGSYGTSVASLQLPFTPSNFVIGTGQLDGSGADEIVIGGDGNPGTNTNWLLILSETSSGWTTQRVDVGPFGITSIAVGQPTNRNAAAIYLGLRQTGGTGRIVEFNPLGGVWQSNLIASSTNSAAFVLGVRAGNDVLASLAPTNGPDGALYSLAYSNGVWNVTMLDTNTSHRGLGTLARLSADNSNRSSLRLLDRDSGGIQIGTIASGESALITNGLSAYYPFAGNGNDASGNAQNLTVNGLTPALDRFGRNNSAYYFDGDQAHYLVLNPFNNFPSSAITLVFWLQTTDTVKQEPMFWSYGSSFLLAYWYTNFYFGVSGPSQYLSQNSIPANDGLWHQFALTWRSSDGDSRLYKDAVLVARTNNAQGASFPGGQELRFGRYLNGQTHQALMGTLDDVRIYNRVLSASEIGTLFAGAPNLATIAEPPATNRLLWRGASLASGFPRLGSTSTNSIFYCFLDDKNLSGSVGPGDEFVIAELQPAGTNASTLTLSHIPITTTNSSYGLASVNFLNSTSEVFFTAEPDGQVYAYVSTNTSGSFAVVPDSATKLLLEMDGPDGSRTFSDSSPGSKTVTVNGDAAITQSVREFGDASTRFDGSGDYLTIADSDDWDFGTGDFTVDFWVRFNSFQSNAALLFNQANSDNSYASLWWFNSPNHWEFTLTGAISIYGPDTITAGVWYHIALVRSGSTWTIYRDGVAKGGATNSVTYPNFQSPVSIGASTYNDVFPGSISPLDGWLDEYRISKGVARWTSTFTPPTASYRATTSIGTGPLQRQLLSAHHKGKAWHALAGVKTLEPGEGLVGLRVDPANPNSCDVIFWPPQFELPSPVSIPQTAPISRVLPGTNILGGLARVPVRLWDAEGNASLPLLQFQPEGSTNWVEAAIAYVDATAYTLGTRVTALPTGSDHVLWWNAAAAFAPGTVTNAMLRARAMDVSLLGDWSAPEAYHVVITSDADGDGLPDAWELAHFGNLNQGRNDDPDHDGVTNLDEYRADTDPMDGDSYLRISGIRMTLGGWSIDWRGGVQATQYVQLGVPVNGTNSWRDLFTIPPPTPPASSYTNPFSTNFMELYRIRALRP